ncbi:MAG: extensin, partial [Caulobacteraceae bacterium]|nr:extensin [Caulobacter sp.]
MARFSWPVLAAAGGLAALAGCSGFDTRERPAWRDRAEEACLAQGFPRASPAITAFREIDGPGICGLRHPFKVRGLAGGSVALSSTE